MCTLRMLIIITIAINTDSYKVIINNNVARKQLIVCNAAVKLTEIVRRIRSKSTLKT